MSKGNKICLLVLKNQSISHEEDNNSDYEIRDDEDQDIREKEDTGKEDKEDEDKKNDSFHFCNKKNKNDRQVFVKNFTAVQSLMYFNAI